MRDALKIFSFIKKMELQLEKCTTAISLNNPGVEVLKHYCYSNEVCAFVGRQCNN
jgi:hypothetical protein